MHRGTIFIIFKDKNNCFKVQKSTEFNGGMGLDNDGHEITFDDFQDLYDRNNVEKEIQEICDNFSIDDEIDIYRQNQKYKENFTIKESLDDFTEYQEKLNNLANNFKSKYFEIAYKKSVEKDEENELI